MAKDDTRHTIIREGARLVHAKGYNNTGLSDILAGAGVPKGSFYFYFKSKDDFGLAVIDYYREFIRGMGEAYLLDASIPPLERFSNFMDAYRDLFEKMDLRCGCPIGNLMQEMSDLSEDFRAKVGDVYSSMIGFLEQCIVQAKSRGDVSVDIDPAEAAQFILNAWEGAIMHMKLAKSTEPLQIFKRMVFERILK